MLLMHVPLTTLDLSSKSNALPNTIATERNHQLLWHQDNDIGAEGVRTLSEALKSNVTLKTLSLKGVQQHQQNEA